MGVYLFMSLSKMLITWLVFQLGKFGNRIFDFPQFVGPANQAMQVLQSNGLKRVPRTGQVRGTEGTGLHCIPPQQSFIFWETVVDILQLCCSNLCCSNLWWSAFKCYCWPSTTAEMLEPDSRGSVGLVSLIWLANPS